MTLVNIIAATRYQVFDQMSANYLLARGTNERSRLIGLELGLGLCTAVVVMRLEHSECASTIFSNKCLTLLEPQSRFGDKLLKV